MSVKIKSALVVAALALVAMTGFVTTVYSDDADADPDTGILNIEVNQIYTYVVGFNISTSKVTSTDVIDTLNTGVFTASFIVTYDDVSGLPTSTVTIIGEAVGEGELKITGAPPKNPDNSTTQIIPVNVVATLSITTDSLTFYKDVARSEGYVSSSNDASEEPGARTGDVVYSAKGLPAGLHMDAGGYGKIYGKATELTTTENNVSITATNLKTGVVVTKNITVNVLGNASEFTLTAGTNVTKYTGDIRYYVTDSSATYYLKSNVTGGTWSAMASGDFGAAVKFSVVTDASGDKLTFTPDTGSNFALSGDYVVTIFHTDANSHTTEQSVVMHFQTGLLFDTVPKASIQVSYTGATFEAV